MTHPEELRRQFDPGPRRGWLILTLVVLVLGVLIAIPTARPAWRALKSWRADSFLKEAEELLAQQQISLAFERARSALQLVPTRPDAIRLNARLLASVGSEASLNLWQHLLRSHEATGEDRAAYVETALTFQRPDLVANLVSQLESPSTENVADGPAGGRNSRLKALYHLQTLDLDSARIHARDAHLAEPLNPTNTLLLAGLLMASDAGARSEARQLLWTVAQTNGPLQMDALERIAGHPEATRMDREQVCDILDALPARDDFQEALLAETRMRLDPRRANEIVADLVAGLRRDDWAQLTAVVGVLARQQRHAEILAVTTAGRSFKNRALFLARYEALLGSGQTEEAYRHLLIGEPPVPPFELEMIRARAAQETGDFKRRDAHLRDLLQRAEDHTLRIRTVARLAEAAATREAAQVATEAWKLLAVVPSEAVNALRHLQTLADRQGDTWTARDYARKAIQAGDADSTLPLWISYYDLLLGEEVEKALQVAEASRNSGGDTFFARAVAALAHLRLGSPANAREVFDRFIVTSADSSIEGRVVLAATYGANGLHGRARELAASLSLKHLRPEEIALIREWLIAPPAGFGAQIP